MAESSSMQTIMIPLLTTALTLAGATWQLNNQNERADRARFIDGAQATAQETSVLLDDGYNALDKLVNATDKKGWDEFYKDSWSEYWEFHRRWRQQLIVEHFKLVRYFGKDIADQLVHADEIDLHPVTNLSAPNPCTPPGDKSDYDVEKLASQIECNTRLITVGQDIIDKASLDKTDDLMAAIKEKGDTEEFASKLLKQYDKASVSYLRALDARLTQLGEPQVTVLSGKPRG